MQQLTTPVPNPIAWTNDNASPVPNLDNSANENAFVFESNNSNAATPDRHNDAAWETRGCMMLYNDRSRPEEDSYSSRAKGQVPEKEREREWRSFEKKSGVYTT